MKKQINKKFKKVFENPGVAFETGAKKSWETIKDFGHNKKIQDVIDHPGITIENGIKTGWNIVMVFGKGIKKGISKDSREKKKTKRKKALC